MLVDALNAQMVRGGVTAFKYSAGACARSMPTYDDGTCNTLTADWHAPALAVRTANTGANRCGISENVTHTVDAAGPEAVAFAQNTRDEVRIQGDGTISGALSAQPGMKQQTYVCMASGASHAEIEVGWGVSDADRPQQERAAVTSNGQDVFPPLCATDGKCQFLDDQSINSGRLVLQPESSGGVDIERPEPMGPAKQPRV